MARPARPGPPVARTATAWLPVTGSICPRLQLALNVSDIDEAVAFCSGLSGTGPAKRRAGYASFTISELPLKPVLLENPGQGGTLNHLGVEVGNVDAADAEQTRLAAAGLASAGERDTTTCCYAKQDKFWVPGRPGGEQREVYPVLAGSPALSGGDGQGCCGPQESAAGEALTITAAPGC